MDLSNIKIVFVDIDGTLVDDNKKISDVTKRSIKRIVDKGIYVVLVSGRDLFHAVDKSKEANASSIVITTNGGDIYDYDKNEHIFFDRLSEDKITKIWDYCKKNKIGMILKSSMGVYYNKYSLVKNGINYKLITSINECDINSVSQLLIMSNTSKNIDDASVIVKNLGLNVTSCSSSYFVDPYRDYFSIDINNPNISKGATITNLLKYLNIRKDDSICFGDFINDLEMFDVCGLKVAMGNALKEIKDAADFITDSNNDNGVANFLDKYL